LRLGHLSENNHFTLQYYAQQSVITDPSTYSSLFENLPQDLPSLVKTVQGLLISLPWEDAYGLDIHLERQKETYLRTVPEMLKCILELDPSPLTLTRIPQKRKVSLCRDFAVLLVSILRHQNVPARVRVGFAGYYRAEIPRYWDHRIAEYWNKELNRWVFVDAMTEEPILERLRFKIDPFDIDTSSQFLLAGEVWQKCRAGRADSQKFGDSPDDLGMAPIRYALLQDFDYLNKNELVGFDAWHPLINKPENEVTKDEKALLDEIAEMTNHVDSNFKHLRELYQTTSYGQTVQNRLSSLGF